MAKAVTKQDPNQVPDYLRDVKGTGLTSMDSSDVVIPRIALLQGLSPACETFDDARPGRFWHTIMDESLGDEMEFIVCADNKRFLLSPPLGSTPDTVLARANDGVNWQPSSGEFEVKLKGHKEPVTWKLAPTVRESGLAEWGSQIPGDPDSKPAATMFYDYLSILPDRPDLGAVVISLSRSAIKRAKKELNSKIQLHAGMGRPVQSLKFIAKAIKEEGDEGPYFVWSFQSAGFASEEEYNAAKTVAENVTTFRPSDEDHRMDGDVGDGTGNGKEAPAKEGRRY